MASTAHLEIVVGSSGVISADAALKKLTQTAAETEKQQGRRAAATEKQIARENEMWNDAKQKAIASYDRKAEAAEKAAKRQVDAAEKAAKRENELWNNAIQRAKAGLDGVLPIRPSLQRMEARMNAAPSAVGAVGVESSPLAALGGSVSGMLPQIAAATAAVVGLHKVIADTSAYDGLIARLAGVTGGAAEARKQFDKLEALSDKTIFTENAVTEAFIRMEQNGLKPTEATLSAFANIASATGSTIEQLAEVSLAASLGNFKGLRQFGIKAVAEGDILKVKFKGITTEIGTSAEAITQYLVGIGENDFAGAAARQLDTMGGAVKQFEDAWSDLFREVGRSAVGEFIATGMKVAAEAIKDATTAFEALLYTASQRPKFTGMSADLAAFAKGAAKWGAPKTDEEIALEEKTQAAVEQVDKGIESKADKDLREYLNREKTLTAALFAKMSATKRDIILTALDENKRQYDASVNAGNNNKSSKRTDYDVAGMRGRDSNLYSDAQEREKELQAIVEHEAKLSELEVNRQENEQKAAEKAAMKQIALQRKLASIGIGPQSQIQQVNTKTAGAYYELGDALGENLSGKNGEDLKLEAERTYAEKSVAIERERAEEIATINRDLVAQSAQNAELIFAGLATAMKNGHGEMSAEYRTMFAIQKAFGIVSAEIAMYQAMAEAGKVPFPANIPLYLKAAAQGAQIVAQMSSLSYSGAYDEGGNIRGGSYGDVGERGWELVRGAKVSGPAQVIGREATAAMLGGGGGNIRIVNAYDGGEAVRGFLGSTAGQQVLVNFIKRNGALVRTMAR